tara:strand:+ start:517 stop:1125 length:609 start_codon:yes stop_codon:yes gene_type:complete
MKNNFLRKMIKVTVILIGILLVAFIFIQIFAMKSQKNIESYAYTVDKKYDYFEIRSYKASLFTSIKLPMKDYKNASNKGFSILAGYIFGGNDRNEKISMTSPVSISLEDSMRVMFLVPKKFNKKSLPIPNQTQIEFREEPIKTVAAITFGGFANDEKIKKYKEKLIKSLNDQGIKHTSVFYFLGYNPPFEAFNRRNEVIVEI